MSLCHLYYAAPEHRRLVKPVRTSVAPEAASLTESISARYGENIARIAESVGFFESISRVRVISWFVLFRFVLSSIVVSSKTITTKYMKHTKRTHRFLAERVSF